MGIYRQKRHGFTVVELLVVIAVIGILASIAMVVYPGYQRQVRDDERRSDLGQISAALGTYAVQKNTFVGEDSGCGVSGDGNGWLNATGTVEGLSYPRSIVNCLEDAETLGSGDFIDPSNCLFASGGDCGTVSGQPAKAYMKATCTKSGNKVTYLFAHLESEPRKDSEVDALCDNGTVLGFTSTTQKWGTRYGMNYYVSVR